MSTIADRLRIIRGDTSRAKFSAEFEVHPQTLIKYENGERTPPTGLLQSICEKRGVLAEWLLLGVSPMKRGEASEQPREQVTAASIPASEELGELRQECRELRQDNRDLAKENRQLLNEKLELTKEVTEIRGVIGGASAMDPFLDTGPVCQSCKALEGQLYDMKKERDKQQGRYDDLYEENKHNVRDMKAAYASKDELYQRLLEIEHNSVKRENQKNGKDIAQKTGQKPLIHYGLPSDAPQDEDDLEGAYPP